MNLDDDYADEVKSVRERSSQSRLEAGRSSEAKPKRSILKSSLKPVGLRNSEQALRQIHLNALKNGTKNGYKLKVNRIDQEKVRIEMGKSV